MFSGGAEIGGLPLPVESLRAAVQDTQETIRAFDVKAEVLAVALAIVVAVWQWVPMQTAGVPGRWLVGLSALFALACAWCVGAVLIPRSKTRGDVNLGGYSPQNVFRPPAVDDRNVTVAVFAERARQTDWVLELTYELFKLARIRVEKEKWFQRAIYWAGAAFFADVLALIVLLAR
jgi:hypothetical protein